MLSHILYVLFNHSSLKVRTSNLLQASDSTHYSELGKYAQQ